MMTIPTEQIGSIPRPLTLIETVAVQSDDPMISWKADRERVEQIVLNLLSNAVKFTPSGGMVRVAAAPTAGEVRIQVSDTGVGIPADHLEKVFEPFVQVETGRVRPTRGTGLGLAISRELARAMHGDLTAESERGKGTTFTLRLPRDGGESTSRL